MVALPGNQAANGENKPQPAASEEAGLLDSVSKVKTFIKQNKLDNVQLLGQYKHEKVISLIKNSCFLIFPSECYETFGRVIIEAYACGIPVIASHIGAMKEIFRDKKTGLYFEPGNPMDLATKIKWAWTHPKEMQKIGKAARKEFETKYNSKRNYEILMKIYRKVLNNH